MPAPAQALTAADRTNCWFTPQWVLDVVLRMGPIGLDPCWDARSLVRPAACFTVEEPWRVWSEAWTGHGLVFCNPPYGAALEEWAPLMAGWGVRGAEVIGLVPAATDVRWWWRHIGNAPAVAFWRRRIPFHHGAGEKRGHPGFACVSPYWGPRVDQFRAAFADNCTVYLKGH